MNTSPASLVAMEAKSYSLSPYTSYFGLLRDAPRESSWELFGAPALPAYFRKGMEKFYENLEVLKDLSRPFSANDEKQLSFMLESLLQVRQLIVDAEEKTS